VKKTKQVNDSVLLITVTCQNVCMYFCFSQISRTTSI